MGYESLNGQRQMEESNGLSGENANAKFNLTNFQSLVSRRFHGQWKFFVILNHPLQAEEGLFLGPFVQMSESKALFVAEESPDAKHP